MLNALEQSLGVVTQAIKNVGISRSAHYLWMQNDEEYAQAVNDIQDVTLDFAESQLYKQILNGSSTATIFFLRTRGRKRGYIERHEVDQRIESTVHLEPIDINKLSLEQRKLLADIQLQLGSGGSEG